MTNNLKSIESFMEKHRHVNEEDYNEIHRLILEYRELKIERFVFLECYNKIMSNYKNDQSKPIHSSTEDSIQVDTVSRESLDQTKSLEVISDDESPQGSTNLIVETSLKRRRCLESEPEPETKFQKYDDCCLKTLTSTTTNTTLEDILKIDNIDVKWNAFRTIGTGLSNHGNIDMILEAAGIFDCDHIDPFYYKSVDSIDYDAPYTEFKNILDRDTVYKMIQVFPELLSHFENTKWICGVCGCGPDEHNRECKQVELCCGCECGGCGSKRVHFDDCAHC
jgi:hypothetical protein